MSLQSKISISNARMVERFSGPGYGFKATVLIVIGGHIIKVSYKMDNSRMRNSEPTYIWQLPDVS